MAKRVLLLTLLAMTAFAANSLLCRLALKSTSIDPASFTAIRLIAGAAMLTLIVNWRRAGQIGGNWLSALALFAYAGCFSFSYLSLPASTGALLLFGAVQTTMLGYGFKTGERLNRQQLTGVFLAFSGLIGLLLPGLSMPPLHGAILMLLSGLAWGIYSLRAKGSGDPTCATAGNFIRASIFAIPLSALYPVHIPASGLIYAVLSGAIASGLGYAIWYTVLRDLKASSAATVQLSVPIIAALGGVVFLNEILSLRLLLAGATILGGIALVISGKSAHK